MAPMSKAASELMIDMCNMDVRLVCLLSPNTVQSWPRQSVKEKKFERENLVQFTIIIPRVKTFRALCCY